MAAVCDPKTRGAHSAEPALLKPQQGPPLAEGVPAEHGWERSECLHPQRRQHRQHVSSGDVPGRGTHHRAPDGPAPAAALTRPRGRQGARSLAPSGTEAGAQAQVSGVRPEISPITERRLGGMNGYARRKTREREVGHVFPTSTKMTSERFC